MQPVQYSIRVVSQYPSTQQTSDKLRGIGEKEVIRSCHVTSMIQPCVDDVLYRVVCVLLQLS